MEFSVILHEIVTDEDKFIPLLIVAGVVIVVLFVSVRKLVIGVAQERTKREIAAYIAEGSMTPEQGERLVRAAPVKRDA